MSSTIIGEVLLNQFRVDEFIQSGGMGAVYKVWDLQRNVSLAMKVLNADLAEDPHIYKRFQREASALKKLSHPNIVPFYGLYKTPDFTFLLERFIDGPSLKEVLKNNPLPDLQDSLIYLQAICASLGFAHAHGVVHCDVKPGNVMIDRGGSIYLTDFGIARHADSTTTTLGTAGTAAYMAPEQIRAEPVSPATDIYSLGVLSFELLSGQRPFTGLENLKEKSGETQNERLRSAHLYLSPPDPCSINHSLSENLGEVVLKALNKDPQERFQGTQEFFTAICTAAGIASSNIPDRINFPGDQHISSVQLDGSKASPIESKITGFPQRGSEAIPLFKIKNRGLAFIIMGLVLLSSVVVILVLSGGLRLGGIAPTPTLPMTQASSQAIMMTNTANGASPTPTQQIIYTDTPYAVQIQATPTNKPARTITLTATAVTLPPTPITTINSNDNAQLVLIPAGNFIMGADPGSPYFWGAEAPAHRVNLKSFQIYITEVTNAMYSACVRQHVCPAPESVGSATRPSYYGNPTFDNYPVIYVSYSDAVVYCRWAGGRLPTEAEWEKAARGDDGRLFPWGNGELSGILANFCDEGCPGAEAVTGLDDGYRDTSPVGNYKAGASPYGVLDMAGNVLEWVADWMQSNYYQVSPQDNPTGPLSGERRVVRGGSWLSGIAGLRTVARASVRPDITSNTTGFRCAVDVK